MVDNLLQTTTVYTLDLQQSVFQAFGVKSVFCQQVVTKLYRTTSEWPTKPQFTL